MRRVEGKVAIVTGGASGIGHATSVRLAEEGAKVVIADLDAVGGEKAAAEVGGIFVQADISSDADARRIAERTAEQFGRIDILVNNAASFVLKGLEADVSDWQKSLGTNVIGTALVTRYVVDRMKLTGGGAIVNVSSQSALFAQPGFLTYSSGKAAIIHMTRLMALDLAPFGIRVNTVCPGTILTPASYKHMEKEGITVEQFEAQEGARNILPRLGRPREVANAILFLASDEASFITAASLLVDGGRTALS